jgi:branched-chain amino acid transport system substrate-binding protein
MRLAVAVAASGLLALAAVSVAAGGTRTSAAAPVGSGTASATKAICGMGSGKKAKGTPIKLGGIFTLIPGVDFTTVGKIADAYFKCVNDNGGINGQPIKYTIYTEQLDPAADAALAKKLIESDKVVGVVGNTSLAECAFNNKYYASKGYYVIGAGVPGECFGSSAFAAVNMGPRYSDIGAAQALVRAKAKSIVIASPAAIADYSNGGVELVAKTAGVPYKGFGENLPITDPNSIIQKLVQAAGPGGGVILNFTPESATPLMLAAIQQGVVNQVTWASSTPIANAQMATQLGAFDNGRMLINSEFSLLDTAGADQTLYRDINAKYSPKIPVQSFGQMGFLVGKFVTAALLSIKGPVTSTSYNAAAVALKNQHSDMLCSGWYFQQQAVHIPNNIDITVTYSGGKVVKYAGCIPIQAVDQELKDVRAYQQKTRVAK